MRQFLKKLRWLLFGPPKPVKKKPEQAPVKGPVSKVFPLEIPLEPDEQSGWKPYPLFKRSLTGKYFLAAHVSVLIPGHCPHLPHKHAEEEILLMLAGEADLLIPEDESGGPEKRRRAIAGEPYGMYNPGLTMAKYLVFEFHFNELSKGKK